jgi:L,D-peptidoglycan transpeptidase YkuD (ErfK/YbiS/YcfS/YnhG family)
VAGRKARRLARAARWSIAFVAAAALLGIGTPVLSHAVHDAAAVQPAQGLSSDGLAALSSAAAAAATASPEVHLAVPRGYSVPAPVAVATPSASATPAPAASTSAAPARVPSPAVATTTAPAAPAAIGKALPLPVTVGRSTQVVTVVASSSGSTTATLTAWQLGAGGWTVAVGPVQARIGAQGLGQASETTSRTPAGTFSLTEGFGRLGNPGTRLPYRVIDAQDWWVSDVASPLYNQHTRCAVGSCPFREAAGENLYSEGAVYNHALVIDYNRGGTPGAGSAFFLHVTNNQPTAGCVAIDDGHLTAIMRWLDPAARPLISIGVG